VGYCNILQPVGNISVYKLKAKLYYVLVFKINLYVIFVYSLFLSLNGCQSVANKINEKSAIEERELSKWLDKTETELKIKFGQPDKVEFLKSRNRNYIYLSKKMKIECQRTFEINSSNIVVGFKSKNCF